MQWQIVGFVGQGVFTARFLVQWIASEKKRDSVVPVAFWWLSLVGGLNLLVYAIHRQDPVFILGQSMGMVVYVRNLMLVGQAAAETGEGGGRASGAVPARTGVEAAAGRGCRGVTGAARSRGASPRSCSTARPMSAARMRVSPTSMAGTPAASRRLDVGAGPDAALGDEDDVGGDLVAEADRQVEVGDEPVQVAVVDADEVGPRGQDAGQVARVVELDQGGHPPPPRQGQERRQLRIVEDLGDQEDGIGAGHPGLDDLVLVDQEVLAEDRDRHRRPDPGQVRQVPLEVRDVGQDAQAGGAVGLVGPGDGDRVEVGADHLGRRAGLLDLGDELDRPRPGQRGAEVADRRGLGRLGFQLLDRQPEPGGGDFLVLGGDDLVEDRGAHGDRSRIAGRWAACVFTWVPGSAASRAGSDGSAPEFVRTLPASLLKYRYTVISPR